MGLEIGPLHVRRSALVAAPPARVWEEFTTQDRLAAWYGHGHTLERFTPVVGSEVRLSVEIDGARRPFGGRLLVYAPAEELSYESNWHGEDAWPVPLFHTLRLSATYTGTRVELFHHGFERLGAAAGAELESYETGWTNRHLVRLRAIVEGAAV